MLLFLTSRCLATFLKGKGALKIELKGEEAGESWFYFSHSLGKVSSKRIYGSAEARRDAKVSKVQ